IAILLISCDDNNVDLDINLKACFTTDVDTTTAGIAVNFTNCSDSANFYHWDFGDGNSSIEENPKHSYSDSGLFTITLLATDKLNNSDYTVKDIYVNPPNIIDEDDFFKTYDDLENLLITTYERFFSYYETLFLVDANYSNKINSKGGWSDLYQHTQTSSNSKVESLWRSSYKVINLCNELEYYTLRISQSISNNEYSTILNNLKGIRAFVYLNLINWFGDVPLITERYTSDSDIYPKRDDLATVIEFVLNEANQIIELFPFENQFNAEYSMPKEISYYLISSINRLKSNQENNFTYLSSFITESNYPLETEFPSDLKSKNQEFLFSIYIDPLLQWQYTWEYRDYVPIISSSLLHLIYEEANLKSEGEVTFLSLNKLLVRNSLPTVDNTTTISDIKSKIIYLFLNDAFINGNSFLTLKSNSLAIDSLNIDSSRLLLPIPENDIMNNPNMAQNPGY
ncbi:MAG: RagB/SusD family nutrient uptake outer membrane protein, partial [Bacteroidales bacterium]|nr:RagB/SusD family nutrient uptake outer membrane protein [Bacteroidales bacterium]